MHVRIYGIWEFIVISMFCSQKPRNVFDFCLKTMPIVLCKVYTLRLDQFSLGDSIQQ
jgi:hypothetical protein